MREKIQDIIRSASSARTAGLASQARRSYGQAADMARTAHEHMQLAHALRHMSELDRACGDFDSALDWGNEAVALYRADPNASALDLANALRVKALALDSLERSPEAVGPWREARELYAQLRVQDGVAECDTRLGQTDGHG